VWVDTYGAAFSRDLEPSFEAGDVIWQVGYIFVVFSVFVFQSTASLELHNLKRKCQTASNAQFLPPPLSNPTPGRLLLRAALQGQQDVR
jgi:hypothetical protein